MIDLQLPIESGYDKDEIMAYAIVRIMLWFFEEEKPLDIIDYQQSINKDEWLKLIELHSFFKQRDKFDEDGYPLLFNDILYEELTAKLIEIVQLRGLLWT